MVGQQPSGASRFQGKPSFTTTHWSVVLAAANEQSPESTMALERLCQTYWYPLYAYVRRRGCSPEDAQDLTQEFFARLLRKHYLGQIDPHKGKFRSFLLAAINHFLANEWDRTKAVKRGGRLEFLSWDQQSAENRLAETARGPSPEQIYERCWGITLLNRVLLQLREEATQAGRAEHFEGLKPFLTGENRVASYAELADRWGSNEAALRKEVQRLRQRYGELLRQEIEQTVSSSDEVEAELCYLFTVLSA